MNCCVVDFRREHVLLVRTETKQAQKNAHFYRRDFIQELSVTSERNMEKVHSYDELLYHIS